jgi:hypothetical protein
VQYPPFHAEEHAHHYNKHSLLSPSSQSKGQERDTFGKEGERKEKKGSQNSDLSSAQDEGKIIIEIREAIASLQLLPDSILIAAGHLGLKKQSTNLLHALLLRLPCVVICHPWLPPTPAPLLHLLLQLRSRPQDLAQLLLLEIREPPQANA